MKLTPYQKRCLVVARGLEEELVVRRLRYWTWPAVAYVFGAYRTIPSGTIAAIAAAGLVVSEGEDLACHGGLQLRCCGCHWGHLRLSEAGWELGRSYKVFFDEPTRQRIAAAASQIETLLRFAREEPAVRRARRAAMLDHDDDEVG